MMMRRLFSKPAGPPASRESGPDKPYIDENQGVRRLYFDGTAVQSSMRLSDPYALDLGYTKGMMGFLLFNDQPAHILIVGLGGGSLSKYCYHHLPQTRITTLEINQDVIALRDEFLIPADAEGFQVVHADAVEYLDNRDIQTDVILLDGYDISGLPDDLCSETFYSRCWQALRPEGVLVANLWGGCGGDRGIYINRLRAIFDGRVWWCTPRDSCGLIVYAVKSARYCPQWSRLMRRALTFKVRYGLDFPPIVNSMRRRPEPD